MYWHIDTDIISLLVLTSILTYTLGIRDKSKLDSTSRRFIFCMWVGAAALLIDIFASVLMEVPGNRFLYHLLMTLDFSLMMLTIVAWFCYCVSLLFQNDTRRNRRWQVGLCISYLVCLAVFISNLWSGWIYRLDVDLLYQRGPLFFIMPLIYLIYALALLVVIQKYHKNLPKEYPFYILLLTPVLVTISIPVQLMNAGWLMILPAYSLGLLFTFIFRQSLYHRRRQITEQMAMIMDHLSGGIIASVIGKDNKFQKVLSNSSYYQIFGYTKEQYENEVFADLDVIVPQEREIARAKLQKVFEEQGAIDAEFHCIRRDGSLCVIRANGSVTQIPGIGDKVLLSMISDVTEAKAHEEAAVLHEAEMRLAMEQMGKMLCEYNFATDKLTVPETYAKHYNPPPIFPDSMDVVKRKTSIDPASWDAYQAFQQAVRRGDPSGSCEILTHWIDGTTHWEHATFSTLFDSAGKPVKSIIAVEDTTEQHQRFELEQSRPSLGESNLLVHARFNLSSGETLEYSYRDGHEVPTYDQICFSNDLSVLEEAIPNREERRRFMELNNLEKLLERFENGESEKSIDYRRRVSEDEVLWVRNILRMVRQLGGTDVVLFEYCYNIEDEKTQELMYNSLVNANFDFVGRINGRNGHYELLTSSDTRGILPPSSGNNLDEMVRTIVMPYAHRDDRNAVLENLNVYNIMQNLADKDQYQFTFRLILKDGSVCYKTHNMYYLDRERRIILITREDVSATVQAELRKNDELSKALAAANAANHAKSRFLSRMSHELRTPMNIILGASELAILSENIPAQEKETFETITNAARYLFSLINDILEISRIEGGKITLNEAPFEMNHLLAEVGKLIEPRAEEKNINYRVKINSRIGRSYVGDSMKLQQILVNLLDNAIKFTDVNGVVTLVVEELCIIAGKARMRFVIIDDGVGISQSFLPHLFELFSQESTENTSTVTGTGIGLPVAKSLVDLMHGTIKVRSSKGSGSEFTVEILLRVSNQQTGTIVEEGKSKEIPDFTGRRIMVAEDNPLNAMMLEKILNKAGAEVVIAENGRIAVDKYYSQPVGFFDAILMDIRMPEMDGLSATRQIRSAQKDDCKLIPIIAVSANAFDEDVNLSLESGMNEHLAKPVETFRLFNTLNELMR